MKKDDSPGGIEEKIGHAMVKGKLITESQLKTALDYQRSLGGTLTDVITKLGFVRAPVLHRFLSDANLLSSSVSPRPGVKMGHPEGGGKTVEKFLRAGRSQTAKEAVDESELPTQKPLPPGEGHLRREVDPVLEALIKLLVQKGVIGLEEQEQLLHSGCRTLLV